MILVRNLHVFTITWMDVQYLSTITLASSTGSTILQGFISIRARLRRDALSVYQWNSVCSFTVRTGGCELRSQWHSTGSDTAYVLVHSIVRSSTVYAVMY